MKLSEIVAEVMTFNKNDYRTVLARSQQYFTTEGYKQYTQFIVNSGFETTLSGQDLQTGVLMDGNPVELGRGVYGGAFKWFFEIPVTISLIPAQRKPIATTKPSPEPLFYPAGAICARKRSTGPECG